VGEVRVLAVRPVGFVVTAVLVKIAVVGGFAIRRSRRRTG
jgi:hypothetical protein